MGVEQGPINKHVIETLIPHRRPFMFLKEVEVLIPGIQARGQLEDLSHPDFSYLKGHFPNFPVIPGAILMDALAQLAGVAFASGKDELRDQFGFLAEDNMRYRLMAKPGDTVLLEAHITKFKMGFGMAKVKASKDEQILAEGDIKFRMINPQQG